MKHLILIKVRTADPHVTLKFPFVSMCKKRVLANLKIKKMDQFLERLIPPCRSFLDCNPLHHYPIGMQLYLEGGAWFKKKSPLEKISFLVD